MMDQTTRQKLRMMAFAVAGVLAASSFTHRAAADDTFRHLQWEHEQQQQRERENGYPNSGYSNPQCGWGCKLVFGIGLAAIIAAAAAEQAKKQQLQQQRGY